MKSEEIMRATDIIETLKEIHPKTGVLFFPIEREKIEETIGGLDFNRNNEKSGYTSLVKPGVFLRDGKTSYGYAVLDYCPQIRIKDVLKDRSTGFGVLYPKISESDLEMVKIAYAIKETNIVVEY